MTSGLSNRVDEPLSGSYAGTDIPEPKRRKVCLPLPLPPQSLIYSSPHFRRQMVMINIIIFFN